MKKMIVIGRGTGGSLAISHMNKWLSKEDWELEWHFDPSIKTQAVGEGSTLVMPRYLFTNLNFTYSDLDSIDGTFKRSIYKQNWGKTKNDFHHNFIPAEVSYHFNAVKLQDFVYEKLKNQVKIVENNVVAENLDADYVFDCSGKPSSYEEFYTSKFISVNAVHVNQCFWDFPKFNYTLTIARPYGWVFGIPLRNRCSIGYMYNKDINTLEEVKEDIKEIFKEYNLTPSDETNSFEFANYYRKRNFQERISRNGNASFFLEPLEATSIDLIETINRLTFDVAHDRLTIDESNAKYAKKVSEIENIIMMHYYAGSNYDSDFWKFAENRGKKCMTYACRDKNFVNICINAIKSNDLHHAMSENFSEYGTWQTGSFYQNIRGLGIQRKLLHQIAKP